MQLQWLFNEYTTNIINSYVEYVNLTFDRYINIINAYFDTCIDERIV